MADRYCVVGQAFITNGAVITSDVTGRVVAASTLLTLSTTGGAGTFTITLGSGCTGTLTSGTATITDSPKALVAGANTCTSNGAGNCTLALTLGTGGNWNTVNSWSAATGGVSGASVPSSSDNCYFDSKSFSATSQTLTVDVVAYTLAMDWTGATNSPTFTMGNYAFVAAGNLTFITGMTVTNTGWGINITGTCTLTSAGKSIKYLNLVSGSPALTLADAASFGRLSVSVGTLNTSNQTVSIYEQGIVISGASAKTLTFGTSVVTITVASVVGFDFSSGSNLTLADTTGTITLNNAQNFAGGSPTGSYGAVNLNSTAHTISGSFTCVTLALPAATTQTITLTAGIRVTCTTVTLSGDATHAHTIQSGTAGTLASIWATSKTDSYVTYTDMLRNYNGVIVANCAGTGGGTFAGASGSFTSLTVEGSGNYPLTISGSNTFNTVTVDASQAAKTIKFTDGTTQTVNNFLRDYGGTNIITLTGTSTAGWALALAGGGVVYLDYLAISYSTVTPANLWFAGVHSANSAGAATGWLFRSHRNKNQNNNCGISSDWMYV